MVALKIKNVKQFMNLLFFGDLFDNCTLEEASIKTFVTYNIDGAFEKGFFKDDEDLENGEKDDIYVSWKMLKEHCRDLIKGKNTPVFMKLVFHGDSSFLKDTKEYEDLKALLLIVKFESGTLTLVTGTSFKSFSLDKDTEKLWDRRVTELLIKRDVEYEEL